MTPDRWILSLDPGSSDWRVITVQDDRCAPITIGGSNIPSVVLLGKDGDGHWHSISCGKSALLPPADVGKYKETYLLRYVKLLGTDDDDLSATVSMNLRPPNLSREDRTAIVGDFAEHFWKELWGEIKNTTLPNTLLEIAFVHPNNWGMKRIHAFQTNVFNESRMPEAMIQHGFIALPYREGDCAAVAALTGNRGLALHKGAHGILMDLGCGTLDVSGFCVTRAGELQLDFLQADGDDRGTNRIVMTILNDMELVSGPFTSAALQDYTRWAIRDFPTIIKQVTERPAEDTSNDGQMYTITPNKFITAKVIREAARELIQGALRYVQARTEEFQNFIGPDQPISHIVTGGLAKSHMFRGMAEECFEYAVFESLGSTVADGAAIMLRKNTVPYSRAHQAVGVLRQAKRRPGFHEDEDLCEAVEYCPRRDYNEVQWLVSPQDVQDKVLITERRQGEIKACVPLNEREFDAKGGVDLALEVYTAPADVRVLKTKDGIYISKVGDCSLVLTRTIKLTWNEVCQLLYWSGRKGSGYISLVYLLQPQRSCHQVQLELDFPGAEISDCRVKKLRADGNALIALHANPQLQAQATEVSEDAQADPIEQPVGREGAPDGSITNKPRRSERPHRARGICSPRPTGRGAAGVVRSPQHPGPATRIARLRRPNRRRVSAD